MPPQDTVGIAPLTSLYSPQVSPEQLTWYGGRPPSAPASAGGTPPSGSSDSGGGEQPGVARSSTHARLRTCRRKDMGTCTSERDHPSIIRPYPLHLEQRIVARGHRHGTRAAEPRPTGLEPEPTGSAHDSEPRACRCPPSSLSRELMLSSWTSSSRHQPPRALHRRSTMSSPSHANAPPGPAPQPQPSAGGTGSTSSPPSPSGSPGSTAASTRT